MDEARRGGDRSGGRKGGRECGVRRGLAQVEEVVSALVSKAEEDRWEGGGGGGASPLVCLRTSLEAVGKHTARR